MKSLVVYSNRTGNTHKLAEVVYDTLSEEKEIYPISAAPNPDQYDFIAVGFWLMAGRPDAKTLEYLPGIKKKPLFLFATQPITTARIHFLVNIAARITRISFCLIMFINSVTCLGDGGIPGFGLTVPTFLRPKRLTK